MDQSESPAANLDRRSRRLWLQFSLRTAFVVLTAFTPRLGIVINVLNRATEQREAVKAIEALGGTMIYEWEVKPSLRTGKKGHRQESEPRQDGPAWLRRVFAEHFLQEVHEVTFLRANIFADIPEATESDILKAIPHLKRLSGLKCVWISKYRHRNAAIRLKAALPGCEIKLFALDR